jgi:FkbM family methyltransferase
MFVNILNALFMLNSIVKNIKNISLLIKSVKNPIDYFLFYVNIKKNIVLLGRTNKDDVSFTFQKDNDNPDSRSVNLWSFVFASQSSDFSIEYSRETNKIAIKSSDFSIINDWQWEEMAGLLVAFKNKINIERSDSTKLFFAYPSDKIRLYVRKGFHLNHDLTTIRELWIDKIYEQYVPHNVRNLNIVDIGGYIGDSAIWFASNFNCQVHVYEPHPDLYPILEKNVKLNTTISNAISPFNLGVSDSEKEIKIFEDYSGAHPGFGLKKVVRKREISFKTTTIKNIFSVFESIDLVKMDCEGAEFESLLGTEDEVLRKSTSYILEYHDFPEPLVSKFSGAGFLVDVIQQGYFHNYKNQQTPVGLLYACKRA